MRKSGKRKEIKKNTDKMFGKHFQTFRKFCNTAISLSYSIETYAFIVFSDALATNNLLLVPILTQ